MVKQKNWLNRKNQVKWKTWLNRKSLNEKIS